MTKKDYVAIAAAIKNSRMPSTSETAESLDELAKRLCSIFQNDNPKFDRARFLTACGVAA